MFTTKVPTSYIGEAILDDPVNNLKGTYYLWSAPLFTKYTVVTPEWHNVAFQLCTEEAR